MTYVVASCHGEPLEFGVDVSFLNWDENAVKIGGKVLTRRDLVFCEEEYVYKFQ